MKMEQTECSETLEFKLQTPGNNPEEIIRHSKHEESLKSRRTQFSLNKMLGRPPIGVGFSDHRKVSGHYLDSKRGFSSP
jgi:hypothetical protein